METLLIDRTDDGIVTVTMNRPERKNAVSGQMWDELLAVFTEVRDSSTDRVLVLTGAGGAFCSGADLADPSAFGTQGMTRMRHIGDVALALHRLPKPTIAKVGGVAAGAGCNMALGCDLVIASDEARFSQIFARRGMSVDFGGSWLLPRLIGLHKAKELALLADIISAKEAMDIGLVNRVVPAGELRAEVRRWADEMLALSPTALRFLKQSFNADSEHIGGLGQLAFSGLGLFVESDEAAEGVAAFSEKRQPDFAPYRARASA